MITLSKGPPGCFAEVEMVSWKDLLPNKLRLALLDLTTQVEVYLSGGSIRDLLLNRKTRDIDLVVPNQAHKWAKFVANRIEARLVVLHKEEGVVRVVSPEGVIIDFSEFRGGAKDISQDLELRDFTINALAVPLKEALTTPVSSWKIIDPTGGLKDLYHQIIRVIAKENLEADPLRLLRTYRFFAELGFTIDIRTRSYISELNTRLPNVAAERISTELQLIFETHRAGRAISLMDEDHLLKVIFPELEAARGVKQPSFHHLDVLGHSLLTLDMADQILKEPKAFFGEGEDDPFHSIICDPEKSAIVRMAALFHDIGKPATFKIRERITFYEHDRVGAELFWSIGKRLRFSKKFTKKVALLIRHHMRPFYLLKEFCAGRLTKRAMRRLINACQDYVSLFLVAMADSLASAGPDKNKDLESYLADLFWEIHNFYQETLVPVSKTRLITGKDLIEIFGLEPGPIFRELLEKIEEARVEGKIKTRKEALHYLSSLLTKEYAFIH